MRDNDKVADSLGKNLRSLRTGMLLLGGAIAGLSGGVLVSFISVWSPAAWTYAETIVLFAAVIIGGRGNHLGAVLGAIIVPVGFEESTRLISERESEPAAQPARRRCSGWRSGCSSPCSCGSARKGSCPSANG